MTVRISKEEKFCTYAAGDNHFHLAQIMQRTVTYATGMY